MMLRVSNVNLAGRTAINARMERNARCVIVKADWTRKISVSGVQRRNFTPPSPKPANPAFQTA
jgi:hypothetical protein